ncbi:MAG: glycosyltransferase family 2 protein [bacterium]|nr:glycosyltransferase family 2 protein [bacterium]
MNKVKISIIVPVYNAQFFLRETVASVLCQTYKDFELIFINDGSTDDSLAILEQIKETDSRIKVFSQINKGVTAARKLGWSNSNGKFITFLDADDSFYPNSIELLMKEVKKEDFDIVNGSFLSFPSGRQRIHKDLGVLNKKEYLESLMFGKTDGTIYASIFKKSIFQESTFAFDKTLKIGEDVLMNVDLCSRVNKVKNIDTYVYKYTDNNTTSAMNAIAIHPLYYKRLFIIRNKLFSTIDLATFKKHQYKLELRDNRTIIDSFFSPLIDFDMASYHEVEKLRTRVVKEDLYTFCLSSKYLAQSMKLSIWFLFTFRNLVFKRHNVTKEILS